MKYYLDTEFLEGAQKKWFGKTKPTIDLISIGIVCEDGREYYAISKDFNLEEAWNRYDLKYNTGQDDANNLPPTKIYWIRDNVLKPIFDEYYIDVFNCSMPTFNYKSFKYLISKIGKTNKQIAKEVIEFCSVTSSIKSKLEVVKTIQKEITDNSDINTVLPTSSVYPEFYGYYSDYDWVVFCWLFGRMIDLPKGFPMYCIDLKQILDDYAYTNYCIAKNLSVVNSSFEDKLNELKSHANYPKQTNEHNALEDARWNKQLHEFLIKL